MAWARAMVLPAVMGEGAVGLCHLVRVFPFLDGGAAVVGGIEKLASELIDAFNETGSAIRKRDETHKMAEANRAFSHYRV